MSEYTNNWVKISLKYESGEQYYTAIAIYLLDYYMIIARNIFLQPLIYSGSDVEYRYRLEKKADLKNFLEVYKIKYGKEK